MKIKRLCFLVLVCLLALTFLVSCGEGTDYYAGSEGDYGGGATGGETPDDRKVIREFYISLETKQFNDTIADLRDAVAAVDGYEENATVNPAGPNRTGYARIQFRIPTEKVDLFRSSIKGVGSVTEERVCSIDVTLSYADIEARIASLKAEQTRLMELYGLASDPLDLMQISERLEKVNSDLGSYERQLATMQNRIFMTSFTFTVSDVDEYTVEHNFFMRMWLTVVDSFAWFLVIGEVLLKIVIYVFPYVFVIALVTTIVIVICMRKKIKAKFVARRAAKQVKKNSTDKMSDHNSKEE